MLSFVLRFVRAALNLRIEARVTNALKLLAPSGGLMASTTLAVII